MQKLRLIPVEIPEDSLRREWIVEGIGGGKPNGATLWWDFDVPEPTVQGDISMRLPPFDEGDAALLATLLPAMEQGKDLLIEGSVSPRLLDRLTEFQAAFCSWAPDRFAAIGFEATEARISSVPIAPDGAISSFSGGVDSGFTAWRHATNRCGHANQRIVAGLMVHGFDIPLEETAGFDVASRSARDMLETLALPLITVRTNLREVLRMDWLQLFGTALAATLHLMKRSARIGLIASNEPYTGLVFPLGSNPITDPLLGSEGFEIRHDGAAFSRCQKVNHLSAWTDGVEHLRVCWEHPETGQNCGRCEKCIRTQLNFLANGHVPPTGLGTHVDLDRLRRIPLRNDAIVGEFTQIHALGRGNGIEAPWMEALAELLDSPCTGTARVDPKPRPAFRRTLRRLRGLLRPRP